jgi:hypothetical protein
MECVNPSNCFMSLLIPGPKSLRNDFDVFLEPLIEELLELWKGVSTLIHVLVGSLTFVWLCYGVHVISSVEHFV